MILSYSKISSFLSCQKKFFYKYIECLPDIVGPAAELGKITHSIIQQLTIARMDNQPIPLSEIIKQHQVHPDQVVEVESFVSNFQLWWDESKMKADFIKGVEYQFGLDQNLNACGFDDDTAIIHGVIDRVDYNEKLKKLIITDYKTGYSNSSFLQLQLYALGMHNLQLEFDYIDLNYHYLRSGLIDTRTVRDDDIEEIACKIMEIREQILTAIASGEYTETPNSRCCWCSYKHLCNSGKQIAVVNEGKSIHDIAQEYLVLSGRVDDYRKMLKEYCNDGDSIQVGNTVLQMKQTKKAEISDIAALSVLLEHNGYNPSNYIYRTADMRKLQGKKILADIPALKSLLVERPGYSVLDVKDIG